MVLNKLNFKLTLSLIIVHFIAVVIAPLVLLVSQDYLWAVLILPSLLLTNTTWALIHEAIHGNLNSNLKKNSLYARFLACLLYINFETSKFGHLLHHRYNRTDYDLTDGYDSNRDNKFLKIIIYYVHISIGIYFFEVIGPLLLLLPIKILVRAAEKIMGMDHEYLKNAKILLLKPPKLQKLRNIKTDSIINIVILSYNLCIYFYAGYSFLFLSILLVRAFLISSTDNLPHYGASLDLINGAFNLRAPKFWQVMILNFNYHRVHHKYPNVTWDQLPEKFLIQKDYFDCDYFKTYLSQWTGLNKKESLLVK